MKAKRVFENMEFKRGQSVAKALKLGYVQKLLDAIEKELKWNETHYDVKIFSRDLRYLKNHIEEGKPLTDDLLSISMIKKLNKKYKLV